MISIRSLLLLALAAALNASAKPVAWTLTSVTSLGTTITGSFTYDADTNTYSNIQISTSGGSIIPAESWSQATVSVGPKVNSAFLGLVDSMSANLLGLFFGLSLSDAGGAVAVYETQQETCTGSSCSAPVAYPNDPTNGVNPNVTGYVVAASSTPGPLSYAGPYTLPNAASGGAYSATLMASGGSGRYAWSVSAGSLPTGFALSSGGVLSSTGSPAAAANSYSFTVQVTDSAGDTASRPLTLAVGAVPSLFVASFGNGTLTYTEGGVPGPTFSNFTFLSYSGFIPFPLVTTGNGQWTAASDGEYQLSTAGVLTINEGTFCVVLQAGYGSVLSSNQFVTMDLNTGAFTMTRTDAYSSTDNTSCSALEPPIAVSAAAQFPVILTPPAAPAVNSGGVEPVGGVSGTPIEPGEWVSIYGAGFSTTSAEGSLYGAGNYYWGGNFPTSLGGASVTIDGRPAFLSFVSPNQINLQVPDDPATGPVAVVVTTLGGTFTSTVTLAQFAPSFFLSYGEEVSGIILRSDGSGAYGGGTYDIVGPTGNSFGFATVAAKAGDTVELFGTGFGPTSPSEPAGQAFSGAAPTTSPVNLLINNVSVTPSFAGLSGAGVYQINFTVPPGLGTGYVPLLATVGGAQTQSFVVISLQ